MVLAFLKRLCGVFQVRRLRRRESTDSSPRTTVRLCRLLETRGHHSDAAATARRGLERFPHAHALEDVLRRGFERQSAKENTVDRVAARGAGLAQLAEAVRAYLDFAKLDEAARVARVMLERHPRDPEALLLHGRVFHALFRRDHASRDGKVALESLRKAAELDEGSLEARRNLAAIHHAIGATSQAIFHVLLALEMDPRDAESNALYSQLCRLPFQRRAEKDLLWEAEINDQPLVEKRSRPRDASYGDLIRDGVRQLSRMAGVRRVAMRHRGVAIVAYGGGEVRAATAQGDAFLASAEHLRKASSAWAKRIGMGSFEEATLNIGEVTVFAVAAGGSVLALEIGTDHDLDEPAEEARDLLASWTSSQYRDLEWTR